MNFKKFKVTNNKQRVIIISCVALVLLLTVVIVYRTFALYEAKQEYDAIKGLVPNYSNSDINVTAYVDGKPSTNFPSKDSEYAVEKVECSNNAQGLWNYTNWEINIKNLTSTKTKCKVYFVKQYKESILNGTDPVTSESLIPVTIDSDGTVKKADMTSEWYNYENKVWANAVILEDETKTYHNGEVIPEGNIESYFVWIPRYKYKIFNDGNYANLTAVENRVQTIEIVFENKNIAVSNGSTVGSYLTHPAFTSFDSNGMWVGKFETGYKGATTTEEAQQNIVDTTKVQVKPNVYSWREIQPSNAHLNSYHYQRDLDSHMMKNTEWGAVAYLQHSSYGSSQSVRINNNSAYITGYAAVNEPTCGFTNSNEECNRYESTSLNVDGTYTKRYHTTEGILASTTANISGIYDMSGGSWEYMMSVLVNQNGIPMSGRSSKYHSNFNGPFGCPSCDNSSGDTQLTTGIDFPEFKYYDQYAYAENDARYDRRILGDAIGEMGPFGSKVYGVQKREVNSWYADESLFVYAYSPWILRGIVYTYGSGAGIFAFGNTYGHAVNSNSYRIVLSI